MLIREVLFAVFGERWIYKFATPGLLFYVCVVVWWGFCSDSLYHLLFIGKESYTNL